MFLTTALVWTATAQTFPLTSPDGLKLVNVQAASAEFKGKKGIRVTEAARKEGASGRTEENLAILTTPDFQDGVLEVEVAGQPGGGAGGGARGFVGVAFRIASDRSKFDVFYLRPTNGRAEDQVRRNHSAQYVSFPDWPWQRLRKEFPEKYETYVDLVPGEWTKVKIEVRGAKARLYVHGNAQPTLLIDDVKTLSKGQVALWIGPGTDAHFTNLKISK
ncbi:MAG: hypothetical protein HY820_33805 [Acidobacteria bacterium]|nr:hypothetical protein [Acidobacteriota bacterium]